MRCKVLEFNRMTRLFPEIEREIESKIKDLDVVLVTQSEVHDGLCSYLTIIIWYE